MNEASKYMKVSNRGTDPRRMTSSTSIGMQSGGSVKTVSHVRAQMAADKKKCKGGKMKCGGGKMQAGSKIPKVNKASKPNKAGHPSLPRNRGKLTSAPKAQAYQSGGKVVDKGSKPILGGHAAGLIGMAKPLIGMIGEGRRQKVVDDRAADARAGAYRSNRMNAMQNSISQRSQAATAKNDQLDSMGIQKPGNANAAAMDAYRANRTNPGAGKVAPPQPMMQNQQIIQNMPNKITPGQPLIKPTNMPNKIIPGQPQVAPTNYSSPAVQQASRPRTFSLGGVIAKALKK